MTAQKEKVSKNSYEKALAAYGLAMKAFHKKDYAKSLEAFTSFSEKYPEEKGMIDRANIYIEICNRHLSPDKTVLKSFDDYYRSGVYHLNQGEFEEAAELFIKAHEKKPKAGEVLYYLADTYCLLENVEKCLEYLEQAVKLDASFAVLAQNELDFVELRKDEKFAAITKMA
ncbi:MAG: tetratricopeptide repeat protein [Candidatus Aminicenantes bacterium]|nr:tetratricopeptide repeat protein [Candidatus Aminicenantes bacterium]